ncbi:MAG: methylmalonyl-CoA mutase [Saprospiraceae bacterium]|nr:methylmalonyl-CoA mutase [Saprospiraceae bacterium]
MRIKQIQNTYLDLELRSATVADRKDLSTHENVKIPSYGHIDPLDLLASKYPSGMPPYSRGPYATMYIGRPWTIRQYAGFSTAEESNAFYLRNLAAGQKGLSVAFDLATHRGYDSDHPRVSGDVGKAGVAIDSVEDMHLLFKDIPLDKMSVSMTMNGAVLPILAFYLVVAEETGIPYSKLSGTIQNDILKEFMVRNTFIYPPRPSMRIVGDIFQFMANKVPRFNSISVSGYHMHEAGATADLEIAYTLADGLEYVRTGIRAGLQIDDFAPRVSFFWGIGMNHFTEVAKMRAARIIWAEMIRSFNPVNPKSMALRTHCQTSGWSLVAQDPYNNIARTTMEAISAALGGTQSLHTNALDEALALPSDFTAKVARDTQIYLQKETDLCHTIDPYGGADYIEWLTARLYEKAWNWIDEIEDAGGMTAAIETGLPKRRIEEAAARRQAKIDAEMETIIGKNRYPFEGSRPELLKVDNEIVKQSQLEKLAKVRQSRDQQRVELTLQKVTEAARNQQLNLLEACIHAAKARATLGEISTAIEDVFGRHQAKNSLISGVYAREMTNSEDFEKARASTDTFAKKYGRRPRIMIAKLGQDGHDRGARIIATSFADMGFDVDIGPLFQTPEEAARQAAENDVHFLGISSMTGGHDTLVPETIDALKKLGRPDIQIILGGIVPEDEFDQLLQMGVHAIFGPGTNIPLAAIQLMENYSQSS